MQLLSKSEINAKKASERKIEIDQGIILARKVDKLRETYSEEQAKLNAFRDGTVKVVQEKIDSLTKKVSELKDHLSALKKQRDELQKPLTNEWNQLNQEKLLLQEAKYDALQKSRENQELKKSLQDQEAILNQRIADIQVLAFEKEELASKAREYMREQQGVLADIQRRKQEMENEFQQKHRTLLQKEHKLDMELRSHALFKETLNKKERELTLRERKLAIIERSHAKNR